MEQYLFNEYELSSVKDAHLDRLVAEIQEAPEEHVLQVNASSWSVALVGRWRLDCPRLDREGMYQDEPEACQVDVSFDQGRYFGSSAPFVGGHRTTVHLPFTGDGDLLRMRASRYTMSGTPKASIYANSLGLVVEYPDDKPANIAAEANSWAQKIEQHLSWIEGDLDGFDEALEQRALQAIAGRKERNIQHREHVAKTSLPTSPPSTGGTKGTYVAEAVERRPAPPLPNMSLEKPLPLEPTMSDEAYEDIVNTLHSTGRFMAASARTYKAMGEEDLRQVLLLPLNELYHGQAMAEAFNVEGKTDVLLRWEGKNLFIGECKKWSGEGDLIGALEQLLRYQAWLDTKLALILFVANKDLTAVIKKTRAALQAHDRFVEWQNNSEEDMLRAIINREGDEQRRASLAVLFVHLPP